MYFETLDLNTQNELNAKLLQPVNNKKSPLVKPLTKKELIVEPPLNLACLNCTGSYESYAN